MLYDFSYSSIIKGAKLVFIILKAAGGCCCVGSRKKRTAALTRVPAAGRQHFPAQPAGLWSAALHAPSERHSHRNQLSPSAKGLRFSGLVTSRDRQLNLEILTEFKKTPTLKNDLMYFLNSSKTTVCRKLKQGKVFNILMLSFVLLASHQLK